MKKIFLIHRKGFNYYTDYTELYLYRAFESYGFHLVKDEDKCLFDAIVYISEQEKYMTVVSKFFDKLSDEEANHCAQILSMEFKSEVAWMRPEGEYSFIGSPYRCMFSDTFNAFDEPPFIRDGVPKLVRRSFSFCKNKEPYVEDYIVYGGGFRGVRVSISFRGEDVSVEEASINYYVNKKRVCEEIVFEKVDDKFCCVLKDFEISEGINKSSAVLRGKKRADEEMRHGFCLRFVPVQNGSDKVIFDVDIDVLPDVRDEIK